MADKKTTGVAVVCQAMFIPNPDKFISGEMRKTPGGLVLGTYAEGVRLSHAEGGGLATAEQATIYVTEDYAAFLTGLKRPLAKLAG